MLFLPIALQQMVLYFAPVAHLRVYVSYFQSFLNIFRLLLQNALKQIKGLVSLANNQEYVSQVVETSDVARVLLEDLLVYGLGGDVFLHPVQADGHVFKDIEINSSSHLVSLLEVAQRLRIHSVAKIGLSQQLKYLNGLHSCQHFFEHRDGCLVLTHLQLQSADGEKISPSVCLFSWLYDFNGILIVLNSFGEVIFELVHQCHFCIGL